MRRPLTLIAALVAASAAWADSTYKPSEEEANRYSLEQATEQAKSGLVQCHLPPYRTSVEVMPDIISISNQQGYVLLQFRELQNLRLNFLSASFFASRPESSMEILADGHAFQNGGRYTHYRDQCDGLAEGWAKVLGDALLRLKLEYDKANSPENLAKFKEEALRYQAMDPKPQIPEDARRFRVQAESAVADKRFLEAVEKYGKAIEIAPWWAEAHFNRAVVFAELQNFDSAMSEMKRYLILRPDAPDARQAQDFIYAWEAYPFKHK